MAVFLKKQMEAKRAREIAEVSDVQLKDQVLL